MRYTVFGENGVTEITLFGEMDHHSAKDAREEIDALLEAENPMILRLNLAEINFCDSSGLGFIMGRYRKMNELGGNLTLVNPSEATMRILRLAGLDSMIRTETGKV